MINDCVYIKSLHAYVAFDQIKQEKWLAISFVSLIIGFHLTCYSQQQLT